MKDIESPGIGFGELQYSLFFEELADPVVIFQDGRCKDCNKAALEVLGYAAKADAIGLKLADMSPQKQPDGNSSIVRANEVFRDVLQNRTKRFGWLCRSQKGQELRFDINCSIVSYGGETFICTFWRDMTQQTVLEDRLRESEDRFRIFSLSGQDGVITMDNEGRITHINPVAEKMLGYGVKEVLGKTLQEYLVLDSFYEEQRLQLAMAEVMPFLATPGSQEEAGKALEITARRKDGLPMTVDLSLFSEKAGSEWRVIGIFRDVTERKMAMEALQKSEEKYRRLFEETKDVIFLSSPEGRYLDINKSGIELFGYGSKEEIMQADIGRDLYWDPDDRIEFLRAIESQGFVNMHEMAMKTKSGQKVIVSATANALYDEVGKVTVYQGILRDLTGLKKMEQQLFEYQKLDDVGRMIGDIAHNFNNILNIIIGNAQLAKMSGQCTGEAPRYLASIEDEVLRAADIVEQLLAFGRKRRLDVKVVDMNHVLREFLKLTEKTIGEDIKTRTVFAPEQVTVKIDSGRVNQALLHLVMNAREAMAGKGTLTIEIGTEEISGPQRTYHAGVKPGLYAVLTVSDTGCGIDDEKMKRIFEPFFTGDESGEKKGLGLSVVYGIVKQHGGFIDVESKKGTGTTFKIYLPVALESVKPQKPAETGLEGGNETVLVAEDEPALRSVAAAVLKTLGYNVYLAADGMEALTILKEKVGEIDMVLLDVSMPVMNGVDAFREMKKVRADLPVLFVTGYSLDGIQTNFIFEEGYEAIHKPYTLHALGKKIREVLEKGKPSGGS